MILQALVGFYEQLAKEHPEKIARVGVVLASGGVHAGAVVPRAELGQCYSIR